ncbi:MAG: methyltransferase [Anaerolineae bacterium]|nr:methyltransferase [Anaerolineae bacterium]NUQ06362.1 methyltransferase [Anaerolineae bacterium]
MLSSRERVARALNHQESDRVPLDLGSAPVTGMHVSSVYLLRQALGLDAPGAPVKVVEPYQMLGEIAPDLLERLGVDTVPLKTSRNFFGFRDKGWKPWTFHDGTPLLVPEDFNTDPEPSGDILQYPEGDRTAPASANMPQGGYYFDTIVRQEAIDEDNLNPEDNLEEFGPISDEDLAFLEARSRVLYEETDKAIIGDFGGTAFGDIALVPAPWLKHPKGIRDVTEWYVSTALRQDYMLAVFERQCEIALKNLEKIYAVVGDRITAAFVSGTDFGTQRGPFISVQAYRKLFKPFHIIVNDWIHQNTRWKSFIHSCGSVYQLIPDFIEAGFDIINPVQTGAAEMEPQRLKDQFGDRLVFWGGGIDTQTTLPFGTADQVRAEVRARLRIFGKGGGYVFNTIHNVQAGVSIEKLLALYETVNEYRQYPINA